MIYEEKRDAVFTWVRAFNAIPMSLIEKLLTNNPDELEEVTPPSKYDTVHITGGEYVGNEGKIVSVDPDNDEKYLVEIDISDDTAPVSIHRGNIEVERDSDLPMWGTMWAFDEHVDNMWLDGEFGANGLQKMADCGFRIYRQEDYGYIFGIDGAGYDFYVDHWIPLYDARGLHWHSE